MKKKSSVSAEHETGAIMRKIRLLLFLGCWISVWATDGAIASPESLTEPNVIKLVPIETVDAIEVTPARDILRPKYYLLPLKTELTDDQSLPVFLEVFGKDPKHPEAEPDFNLVDQLLKQDAEDNDIEVIHKLLEKCTTKLNLLRKASLCKTIEWPITHYYYESIRRHQPMGMDMMMMEMGTLDKAEIPDDIEDKHEPVIFNSSEYLDFLENIQQHGKLIALNARYHILKHDCDEAAKWIRVGLRISRQMIQNSNSQLGVMAAANTAVSLQQIELWAQTPNSPGLYRSLQDLPSPFLNAYSLRSLVENTKQSSTMMGMIDPEFGPGLPGLNEVAEEETVLSNYSSELLRSTANRIDRFIAILECLEGLRYYAAIYDGELPNSSFEVTEIRLPNDPITKSPFLYHKKADAAILQTSDIRHDESPFGFSYTIRMTTSSKD